MGADMIFVDPLVFVHAHRLAYEVAGQTSSLVEKRRAIVFRAWCSLRLIRRIASRGREPNRNLRSDVRAHLHSARDIRIAAVQLHGLVSNESKATNGAR